MADLSSSITAAGAAIRAFFNGTCAVTGFAHVKNEATGETELTEITLYSGACRLSETQSAALQTESFAGIGSDAVLFLPKGASVSAGCKIKVAQDGVFSEFEQAGEPTVYATHCQVKMRRVRKA
ncbi:MAG: hypothetical protein Q8878_07025 [Bacillota bacterium]|nr:hypothetical protein [Bacillota bacterium]